MDNGKHPTIRQKKAFKAMIENGGNISKAMVTAGYTVSSAHHTEKLTHSQGWQELMETYLPDDLLVQTALEGLGATKIITSGTEPNMEVKDMPTRHKYLETTLKMKGKIKDDSPTEIKMMIVRLDV